MQILTFPVKNSNLFWMNMNDVQKGLGVKNMSNLVMREIKDNFNTKNPTVSQIKEYKISSADLMNIHSRYSNKIKYIRSNVREKLIKNCRRVKKINKDKIDRKKKEEKRENFRTLLGFKENYLFTTIEESILIKLMRVFSVEKILLQYYVLGYKIDAYFPEHKLAIEIDELGHKDRKINYVFHN